MFSSLNFLFLLSLAVTAWFVLCYFNEIEEQRLGEHSADYTMEQQYESSLPCPQNYDIYLNFICILACVYALAKLTHLTEEYITKPVCAKFNGQKSKHSHKGSFYFDTKSIGKYRHEEDSLKVQINYLQMVNSQLEHKLVQLQHGRTIQLPDNNGLISTAPIMTACNRLGELERREPKVYNSNPRIKLNPQIYLNEGNVKLSIVSGKNQGPDFSAIWCKLLHMQKYAVRSAINPTNDMGKAAPIIISTEELHTVHELY